MSFEDMDSPVSQLGGVSFHVVFQKTTQTRKKHKAIECRSLLYPNVVFCV